MMCKFGSLLLALSGLVCSSGEDAFKKLVPLDIEVTGTQGAGLKPLKLAEGKKAAVFIFVLHDCPIANASAPELERIRKDYINKGVEFYLVHEDPELTPAGAQKHADEFKLGHVVLSDPDHKLAKACGATSVPEAAVTNREGVVKYLGRINDLYADFGKRRPEPSVHDLRNALDAIIAGTPVPKAAGPCIGCLIPDVSKIEEKKK